jgi:hypothetical protein
MIDRDLPDRSLPGDTFYVGVDAQGFDHWYSRIRHTVYVYRDDTRVETEELEDDAVIGDWVRALRDRDGEWQECHVVEKTGMAAVVTHAVRESPGAVTGD